MPCSILRRAPAIGRMPRRPTPRTMDNEEPEAQPLRVERPDPRRDSRRGAWTLDDSTERRLRKLAGRKRLRGPIVGTRAVGLSR